MLTHGRAAICVLDLEFSGMRAVSLVKRILRRSPRCAILVFSDDREPDWEEELSRLVGDVAAHRLGSVARGLADWGLKAADTLALDAGEFLTEESRQIPTRYELEEFLDAVDTMRNDVDRLEARLDRLVASRRVARS